MSDKTRLLKLLREERQALVDFGRQLRPEEWNQPSLCAGWRVRDVFAHVVGVQKDALSYFTTPGLNKANQKMVDRRKDLPTEQLTAELETLVDKPNFVVRFMPGLFLDDTWVHQQDIRWGLGEHRQRQQNPETMQAILNILSGVAKRKYPTLKFSATDLDWSIGEGKEVRGTAEAIAMFLAHRRAAALKHLEGEGLEGLKI
jgi:uncharacterized protein (TIGR03083 family)